MEAVISKQGNNLGLYIPHELAKDFGLVSGSQVDITSIGLQFVVKQVTSLEYLFFAKFSQMPINP